MTLLFKQEQLAALNEEGICAMIDCLRVCCLLKALALYHFETGNVQNFVSSRLWHD